MKAAVSLWSADLLEVGAALDRLTGGRTRSTWT